MGPRRALIGRDTIPTLIEEVKKRECIWNHDNEKYNDRYDTMMAWKEIAEIMDQPEELLKSKWKNLRDLFRREIKYQKRRHKKKIESIDDYKGKWQFFSAMWFIHKPEDYVYNNDNDLEDDQNDETFEEEYPLENFVKFEPSDKTEDEDFFVEAEPPVVNKKRKREEDCDFDMMFLQSLTPYLRQLDPMRKLIARSKMQDVLINEIAAQQAQTNKNTSSS